MAPPHRRLPWLHRLTPRLFYGWWVALGCSLLSFAVVGVGFYGMVVLLDALVTERGWSRESVSAATSLYWVSTGLVGLTIGRAVDRFGARRFIAAGAFVMAGALVWIGRITAPWEVVPAYVMLAMGFALAGAISTGALVTRWFVGRRALAMTLSHTGVSAGGIVLTPLMTGWIHDLGMQVALDRLAIFLLAVALPLALFVLRSGPEAYGLEPAGAREVPDEGVVDPQARIWGRTELVRTTTFRMLASAYGLMLLCQVATTMHLLSYLREQLDAETAALGVSSLAFGSLVGRSVIGPLADRLEKRRLAAALFAFQAVMVVVLAAASERSLLLAASLGIGLTVGNIFMLQALVVGELFGQASFATAMGVQQVVSQVSSGFGPVVLGMLYGVHGGYPAAFLWLAGGAFVAAWLVWRVPAPEPSRLPGTA